MLDSTLPLVQLPEIQLLNAERKIELKHHNSVILIMNLDNESSELIIGNKLIENCRWMDEDERTRININCEIGIMGFLL